MNLKKIGLFIMIFTCCYNLVAQNSYLIKGKITSKTNGIPLAGVNIFIKGTDTGTATNFDGEYSLQVKNGDILLFTYIGFNSQEIKITGQQELNVTLSEDLASLEEVVLIGYGKQKKSHLTGAISKVTNEDLDQIPTARVDDALVGQVAGVNIQNTDGGAGAAPTIRIRGTGSITGNSGPLIVIDGVQVSSDFLGSLNMNDIESFEILKDAASASIFGSRGGNGVILITTKQGKKGKTRFSYNTFTGIKTARQSNAYYLTVAATAKAELAATGTLSDKTKYKQLIGVDNPWQNIIFDGGTIINHSLSARGGSEKTKFSTSLDYLHDEGVLLTDDYKKYNLNIKVDTKVTDKFSFGASLTPSFTNQRRFDGSVHDILRQPAWLPLYQTANTIQYVDRNLYPDVQIGDYAEQRQFDNYDLNGDGNLVDISSTSNTNPGAKVLEKDRRDKKFKIFGSVYGDLVITDGLDFRTAISGDYQNTIRTRYQGVLSNRNGSSASQSDFSNENRIHLVADNFLSYDKKFGKNEVNVIAGISAEKRKTVYASVTGTGYKFDYIHTINAATNIAGATTLEYESTLLSYIGRINYAFDNKYLASISLRRDGSSVFGPNTKYGNFPAFSVGWILSNEDFLKNTTLVSNLKLRFSYGVTGNNELNTGDDLIDNYPSIALLNSTTAVIDGSVESSFNPINIANPDLQWERSVEIDPGIDYGFFNGVISGSVDYYKRSSDQLLLYNPISYTTGFSNALVNLGKVKNEGIELEIRTKNITTDKFKWSTVILASKNKNTLIDFADSNGQIQNVDSKRAAEWINLEGYPISSFYGWVVDKQIPLEYIKDPYHPIGAQAQDVYVKDLNGDGIIDDEDKTILGNPYPDLIWSISNDFRIYNFDLSFMFQGTLGAEVRNMADQYIFNHFNSSQGFDPSTTPNQGFIKQKIFTNSIIQDASYVALRTMNFGYRLPKDMISKYGIFKARIYASGANLIYLTADNYTGWNPEAIKDTSPTTYGYQLGGSPIARTVSFGLNLEF